MAKPELINAQKSTSIDKTIDHIKENKEVLSNNEDKYYSEKRRYNISAFPVVLYQPETSIIFGGGSSITIRNKNEKINNRPDNINLFAVYTLKNQIVLKINPDFYFSNHNLELRVLSYYQKYPDLFYGIGNNTSEANSEYYTTEDLLIQPWLTHCVYKDFRAGIISVLKNTNVLEIEEDGNLVQGGLKAIDGSFIIGFGPVFELDNRNNIFYPSKGLWIQLYSTLYRDWMGSDFNFESYTFNLRYYLGLSESQIFAFQLLGKFLSGDIPFNEYIRLDYQRGINGSRFRDKKMLLTQVEYRFPLHNRFSGTLFMATGDVMNSIQNYSISSLKFSFGFGLRYMLNIEDKINLRFDIGFSIYGISPYFQITEAF